MEELRKVLDELKTLMYKDDEQSEKRRIEIARWLGEHDSPEVKRAFEAFMDEGLADIETEVQDIRKQIADEDYKLLPISYIAKKYFGKSHAWLSQRINGTKVRGRIYTLNEEQKQTFNKAMQDLSDFYGSFRLA